MVSPQSGQSPKCTLSSYHLRMGFTGSRHFNHLQQISVVDFLEFFHGYLVCIFLKKIFNYQEMFNMCDNAHKHPPSLPPT